MSRPCSPEAACERAFYPETVVRKVVDCHDAGTALGWGLFYDWGIFPEFNLQVDETVARMTRILHWPLRGGSAPRRGQCRH
jgi:hypothetical protein